MLIFLLRPQCKNFDNWYSAVLETADNNELQAVHVQAYVFVHATLCYQINVRNWIQIARNFALLLKTIQKSYSDNFCSDELYGRALARQLSIAMLLKFIMLMCCFLCMLESKSYTQSFIQKAEWWMARYMRCLIVCKLRVDIIHTFSGDQFGQAREVKLELQERCNMSNIHFILESPIELFKANWKNLVGYPIIVVISGLYRKFSASQRC